MVQCNRSSMHDPKWDIVDPDRLSDYRRGEGVVGLDAAGDRAGGQGEYRGYVAVGTTA